MAFIRDIWTVVAWSHELEHAPIGRVIAGEPVMLWRAAGGAPVAMEDRCPHRRAPLSLGRIEGGALRCMYHGLLFDRDGACLAVPGADAIPPGCAVRTYPVVERWGWLWLWLGEPARADPALIPEAFGIDGPDWVMRAGVLDYEADHQLINDNLCDLSHLDYVHERTLGAATGSRWSDGQPRVTTHDDGLLIERWFTGVPIAPGSPELGDTFNSYRYLLPGLFLMTTQVHPAGSAAASGFGAPATPPLFARCEQQAVTPIEPGRARYFFASGVARRFAHPALVEGMMDVVNAAFAEDKVMIEAQQRIWDRTPPDRPMTFIAQDKAPAIFRRLIARRIAAEAAHIAEMPPSSLISAPVMNRLSSEAR